MLRPHLDVLPALEVPAGYGLRTFEPGDEGAWAAIMASAGGIGREWTVERVRERMIDREQFEPAGMFFVTSDVDAGRPVASATAWRVTATERELGNVHMVCALESHRGRGLGRLVTLAVLHHLRERGFRRADLSTDAWRQAAIRCYLGLGFVPVYLPDPDGTDSHDVRWSAVFAELLGAGAASISHRRRTESTPRP
jgi:mycothiol synthase